MAARAATVAIVVDASPLILFARAGHLHLLAELFGEVIVPPRVAAEAYLDEPSRPGAAALAAAGAWLRIEAPADRQEVAELAAAVDGGEAEAIALAAEKTVSAVLPSSTGRAAPPLAPPPRAHPPPPARHTGRGGGAPSLAPLQSQAPLPLDSVPGVAYAGGGVTMVRTPAGRASALDG